MSSIENGRVEIGVLNQSDFGVHYCNYPFWGLLSKKSGSRNICLPVNMDSVNKFNLFSSNSHKTVFLNGEKILEKGFVQ